MHLNPQLTPDLLVTTYRGSPISFLAVPTQGGLPISNLASYSQIDFSLWSGTRDAPGTKVLSVKYTGTAPNYITVVDVTNPSVPIGSKGIQVTVPGAASLALAAGQYFAELWLTPPGGEKQFTSWAVWNHEPTTA